MCCESKLNGQKIIKCILDNPRKPVRAHKKEWQKQFIIGISTKKKLNIRCLAENRFKSYRAVQKPKFKKVMMRNCYLGEKNYCGYSNEDCAECRMEVWRWYLVRWNLTFVNYACQEYLVSKWRLHIICASNKKPSTTKPSLTHRFRPLFWLK